MSADDKQVILAEVRSAIAERRTVNQQRLRVLLPHLSPSALNSRVERVRRAILNPRPAQRRRTVPAAPSAAPPQSPPTGTVMTAATTAAVVVPATIATTATTAPAATVVTAATTPVTGAVIAQAATATTATAVQAPDLVQVAIQLARFGGSSPISSAGIDNSAQDNQVQQLTAAQGEIVDLRNQVQRREETIRKQDEDILSSRVEREHLKSTMAVMAQEFESVQSQLHADIASKEGALSAMEQELNVVRSQLQAAQVDIASKDQTITKLNQDVQSLRYDSVSSKEILLQRRLDTAIQDAATKQAAIDKLKDDMKALKSGFSGRLQAAQANITTKVVSNFEGIVEDLKNQVSDLQRQRDQEVSQYIARIANMERELDYTRWVTDMHKYLASVEEDLQALADQLSPFLSAQDRACLYSTRDPREISAFTTSRWACCVYGRYNNQPIASIDSWMQTWRFDRNYFAHHSDTDELDRRRTVVSNAKRLHASLQELRAKVVQENDAVLRRLANDAFDDYVDRT